MATTSTHPAASSVVLNVPNVLTAARLVLSLVLFGLLAVEQYRVSLAAFVVAASTDWLDGYYARKYGQITVLGRILDPFVDKILVCGTFIFLAAVPASAIRPWMAVLIVGREMLVTALRGFLEQRGADFSAQFSGKLKMLAQCIAASVSLFVLSQARSVETPLAPWLDWTLTVAVWTAVGLTVYSGIAYIRSAARLLSA